MHLLILGAAGQLGNVVSTACEVQHSLTLWPRDDADIGSPEISRRIANLAPDVVINCAAWTNVDGAEKDIEGTFRVNSLGALNVARGCRLCDATMVQVSTNEVFEGRPGHFYFEYERPQPSSVYARSKAAGEVAASQILERLFVVRVAWLFSAGVGNFPAKIIAAADRNGALKVVDDEFGNPTYAPDVAAALLQLIESDHYGIYHLVNEGYASRFDFAQRVLAATGRGHIPMSPIKLKEWPRPAQPPPHAVLVNQAAASLGIRLRPWQEAVQQFSEAYLEVREL